MNVKWISLITNAVLSMLFLHVFAGCKPRQDVHGYSYNENVKIEHVKVGYTTEENILKEFGVPTHVSLFGQKTFLYISNKQSKIAFFNPQLKEQKILAIEFNAENKVSNISSYDMSDARQIAFNKDYVRIDGKEISVFKQLIGNLGRFEKSSTKR